MLNTSPAPGATVCAAAADEDFAFLSFPPLATFLLFAASSGLELAGNIVLANRSRGRTTSSSRDETDTYWSRCRPKIFTTRPCVIESRALLDDAQAEAENEKAP